MTRQWPIPNSDRTLLPRSLLGRRRIRNFIVEYPFKVGQQVIFGSSPAVVLERFRSAKGRDHYKIHIIVEDSRPYRLVFGSGLQPVS